MRRSYKGIGINTSKNTHEQVFAMIRNNDKNKVIADIPSGSGAFVQRLKDEGFTNIVAIDIENILEIEHHNFRQADMTKPWDIPDQTCDILVCIDGIEHIDEQFHFVRESKRILKAGGELVISTPNILSLRSRWKWFFTGHHHKCSSPLDETNPNPLHHIGMISLTELRYILHSNGFKINEIRTNRMKFVNLLYGVFLPFVYLATFWVYLSRGKKEGTAKINSQIFTQVFKANILFGETLIVKAKKVSKTP